MPSPASTSTFNSSILPVPPARSTVFAPPLLMHTHPQVFISLTLIPHIISPFHLPPKRPSTLSANTPPLSAFSVHFTHIGGWIRFSQSRGQVRRKGLLLESVMSL
ncbi:hypothetical protein BU26DRAFT_521948 [Trematosphaeria pertusa]|uniref:Uncharacterized protein n=1 Tax=Trematosphaeria pertusa TaxID=390896 RepID=A0A6A6I596_9PLEO|nr:uncharacterized protein BU26DRAFT_521948 [Trematosphaeria pertusa]KAF2245521.1 hypothetical protein BU26DRAFT_521948 [Trematosphaeria pertusa]